MGNTTLQQKQHQEVPDRPGKGAGDEAHMQYRLAVLAICSEMHEAGRTYADIAARFCLCEDTLREWRKRYEENGKEGLRPRDRKPKRKRKSVADNAQLLADAAKWRNKCHCGRAKLAVYLRDEEGYADMSESKARRLLAVLRKEKRVSYVRTGKKRRAMRGNKAKRAKASPVLGALAYECAVPALLSPGERVQMDAMFVRANGAHIAVLTAVDVCTRLAWCHVVHHLTSHAAGVFARAIDNDLRRLGCGGIGIAQTDGGGEFMREFVCVCEELGIKRMVNIPGNPKCGAFVETFNGTLRRECINGLPRGCTAAQIRAAISEYVAFYNGKRPHASLGMVSPIITFQRLPQRQRQNPNM